jgi:hypothetical protein
LREGWVVQFLESDAKTSVGRIRTFKDAEQIRQLVDRTPTPMNLEARSMMEHGIITGLMMRMSRANTMKV